MFTFLSTFKPWIGNLKKNNYDNSFGQCVFLCNWFLLASTYIDTVIIVRRINTTIEIHLIILAANLENLQVS